MLMRKPKMAPKCSFGTSTDPLKSPRPAQDAANTGQDAPKRQLEAPKQGRDRLWNAQDDGKKPFSLSKSIQIYFFAT